MKLTSLGSQSGVGLITATIAIGIIMAGSMALLSVSSTGIRVQKHLDTKIDLTTIMNDIRIVSQDNQLCAGAFVLSSPLPSPVPNVNPSPVAIPVSHIKPGASPGVSPIVTLNGFTSTNMRITGLSLHEQTAPVLSGSDWVRWFRLVIEADRSGLDAVGTSKMTLSSAVFKWVIDGTNGTIKSCGRNNNLGGIKLSDNYFMKTEIIKTDTHDLLEYFHSRTPVACPILYAQQNCGWIRDNWANDIQNCGYAIGSYNLTTDEYVSLQLIELRRSCFNYCVGMTYTYYWTTNTNPDTGPQSWRSAGPPGSPAPGGPYTGGTFSKCGSDITKNGRRWSEIYCECHR